MKWTEIVIIPSVALLVALLLYVSRPGPEPGPTSAGTAPRARSVPDFAAIKDVSRKKRHFFDFMLPKVRTANAGVRQERRAVLALSERIAAGHALTASESQTLSQLVTRYHVPGEPPPASAVRQLLVRVDEVPASLILAQSATESAWGTSRFAREGKNFFGIWCFTPGCGMTPKYRDEGLTHEVARFDSVQQGVNHYLLTINTNMAYRDLRKIRAHKRRQNKPVRGIDLAEGLRRYSERGTDYVRDIQAMIRINRLQQYTAARPLQVSSSE